MKTQIAHRVKHVTRYGAAETLRVFGGPDCDTVAIYVANLFGSEVKSVEAIDSDAKREFAEMDFEGNFSKGTGQ